MNAPRAHGCTRVRERVRARLCGWREGGHGRVAGVFSAAAVTERAHAHSRTHERARTHTQGVAFTAGALMLLPFAFNYRYLPSRRPAAAGGSSAAAAGGGGGLQLAEVVS